MDVPKPQFVESGTIRISQELALKLKLSLTKLERGMEKSTHVEPRAEVL